MKLSALIEALGLPWPGGPDPQIGHVTRDSRQVREDGLFVAVVGASTDGHDFVAGSACAAALVERPIEASTRQFVVPDSKAAMATVAACLAGHPSREIKVVGVTGTNGKTTVTTLASQALEAIGVVTGRVGTTGNTIAGVPRKTAFTTPESTELQPLLAEMREAGVEVALLEVSSIGLVQRRVDAIDFHLGVFTNFTRDHLDFHGSMEEYLAAKAMLFERLRPAGGPPRALLCADDPAWSALGAPADQWRYGSMGDLRIVDLSLGATGMHLVVETPDGTVEIDSSVVGRHNAQNLVAALGICLACGVDLDTAVRGLEAAPGAPGRLEAIPNPHGILVVVDYAHSDDALATVIPVVSELVPGETWVVFGAGGDRDRGKRPRMGAVAESLADHVVLTSDNPRSEDPVSILEAIREGMQSEPAAIIEDRAEAIRWVLDQARPGDGVLIAGKGHETTQQIGSVEHPFDDRDVARRALEAR